MRLAPLAAPLCLTLLASLAAPASFTITNLGDANYDTEAHAVNSSGVAALTSFLPGANTIACGINGQGWVAGTTFTQTGAQAMLFYDGQAWAVANFAADSYAMDVNDAGQVVGSSGGKAFLAQAGWATFLSHPLDSIYDAAHAINESGAVAGTMLDEWGVARAYVWYNGQTQWTGMLGGRHSFATNLNDAGQSTGYAQTGDGWMHAFLAQEGLTFDLGTLGGSSSYAYGINNAGHVAGYSFRADGTMAAFLSIDGVMLDLSPLVAGAGDWHLSAAFGINDSGQIVGTGFYKGRRTAFRLDPIAEAASARFAAPLEDAAVPEPSTGFLILLGLIGVLLTRRLGDTEKPH